jgi:GcrA cell cycle regulator
MKPPHIKYRSIGDQMRTLIHLSNKEIAERLRCHPDTVQDNRRRFIEPSQRRGWNNERVETLKKLWADGFSASQIAAQLGGVTRSGVIGKVHRLGLGGRATTSRTPHPRRSTKRKQTPAVPTPTRMDKVRALYEAEPYVPPVEDLVIPLNERKYVQTLEENDCRWPIGHPGQPDFHFCGKNKIPNLPYCEHHCLRAYQLPQPRPRPPSSPMIALLVENELEAA